MSTVTPGARNQQVPSIGPLWSRNIRNNNKPTVFAQLEGEIEFNGQNMAGSSNNIAGDPSAPTKLPSLPQSFTPGNRQNPESLTPIDNVQSSYGFEDPKKANYEMQMIWDSKLNGDIKQYIKETIKLYDL